MRLPCNLVFNISLEHFWWFNWHVFAKEIWFMLNFAKKEHDATCRASFLRELKYMRTYIRCKLMRWIIIGNQKKRQVWLVRSHDLPIILYQSLGLLPNCADELSMTYDG